LRGNARGLRRYWIAAAIAALAALFYASGAGELLSIAGVKSRIAEARAFHAANPMLAVAMFMAIQVTALALCLPGAVLAMALAGGALFGIWPGVLIVLLSITLGDSLGFLLARYVLADLLAARFREALAKIDAGSGASYLLALRMMAVVPYFIVNIAMALTRMKLRVFAQVSLTGLTPAAFIYVNAGAALAQIESAADIWTPQMLLSFLAIGLLPLFIRWVYRIRRY
jgi:uncharacterized membrane protein YdjX (TVP38/TMEM64 family)